MTLRIIVRTDNADMAISAGGNVETWFKTFDIEHPALEAALRNGIKMQYGHTQVVGVEVLDEGAKP